MRCLVFFVALIANTVHGGDLESRLDAYLQPCLDARNFQGVVLIARGDEILVEKGYGKASLELNVLTWARRLKRVFRIPQGTLS